MRTFAATATEFRRYHSNSFNVALHLVTTPVAMASAMAMLETRWGAASARGAFWAYAGQEAAHAATGEKTYQASYMKFTNWPALLVEHTFYLLPLCLDAVMHMDESFLSWIVAHNYVVRGKLTSAEDRAAMKTIERFVTEEDPDRSCTAHWWHTRLAPKEKDAFTHIAHSAPVEKMFAERFRPDAWVVKPVYGMNEIYVASSHHNNNSDTVFYMEHIDGPWAVYPFCFLYRCMLAVNENVKVETIFTQEGSGGCLSDGDVVGFDFHREIHVIADRPVANPCLLYTSPSPRDVEESRMPSSA